MAARLSPMTELAIVQNDASPPELAEIANREHELARQAGEEMVRHAIQAGDALISAKAQVQYGEWLPWLESNFDASEDTAHAYMKVARDSERARNLEEPSLRKALAAISRRQSVTYKNQPGIEASGGTVPLEGNSHLYRVGKLLWPEEVESFLGSLLISRSLHVCCGKSQLGDVRLDGDAEHGPDIVADAADMPAGDDEYESVLCDPPYNGEFQWNHSLLEELSRVARKRIIFQHWFIPANPDGRYKKAQEKFALSGVYVWQPKTYFGRAQLISVFDADV